MSVQMLVFPSISSCWPPSRLEQPPQIVYRKTKGGNSSKGATLAIQVLAQLCLQCPTHLSNTHWTVIVSGCSSFMLCPAVLVVVCTPSWCRTMMG